MGGKTLKRLTVLELVELLHATRNLQQRDSQSSFDEPAQVARFEVALAMEVRKGLFGVLGFVVVTREDKRTSHLGLFWVGWVSGSSSSPFISYLPISLLPPQAPLPPRP